MSLYDSTEAPILLVGGENDTTPAPDKLRGVVEQLTAKGKPAELLLVSAGHGFAERNHPSHDPESAQKSWATVIKVLEVNTQ